MRMFKKSDEGFTLVELMVVVLIIGILVAIAIPVFNAASRSARMRTCDSNQRTIEGAVQQWLAADPTNVWAADVVDGTDVLASGGSYIKDAPECPASGGGFYSVNASGTINGDTGAAAWVNDGGTVHGHYSTHYFSRSQGRAGGGCCRPSCTSGANAARVPGNKGAVAARSRMCRGAFSNVIRRWWCPDVEGW